MPTPDLGNRYHYLDATPFASGGTADIYRALDRYTGKIVVIKAIRAQLLKNEDLIRRLTLEANILLKLNGNNNIVKLTDFQPHQNSFCLVLEYIDGYSLEHYINKISGPIPIDKAIDIFLKILNAIEFAHTQQINLKGFNGILHLDIKPANVLISKEGNIKIIDFGISEGSETKRNSVMGSPMYMAPEQFDVNSKLNNKTDVYSLGTLFHNMITGKLPYNNCKSLSELKINIKKHKTDRLYDLYPYIDEKYQSFIDTATEKDLNFRFKDCKEMEMELFSL